MSAADRRRPSSISRRSRQRSPGSRSSCATTARRSTGTASSPRSSPSYIARLEKSFSCWRNRLGFIETLQDLARRERLSGLPERARAGERPPPGQPAAGRRSPRPTSCATRWPTSSCATRNSRRRCRSRWPSGSISRTSRTADVFSPFTLAETAKVSVNPKTFRPYYLVHWATFDGSANLPLIYMATIEDSSEAMVAQLVGAGRQAQRQGRHPAAGRRPAQSRACPPLRRFHREELGLFAVAGDDRRQSRQGFRDAASQAAAPRRARAVLFGGHHREQFDGDRRCCPRCGGRRMPGC